MEETLTSRVLYNGSCPVCSREIIHYKQLSTTLEYQDLNTTDLDAWGVDKESAKKRLHVEHNGQMLIGVDAFILLWADIPRYRPLAWFAGLPVIKSIAHVVYEYVLAPTLYLINRNK